MRPDSGAVTTQGPGRACLGCLVVAVLVGALALTVGWKQLPDDVRDAATEWTQAFRDETTPWPGAEEWFRVTIRSTTGTGATADVTAGLLAEWRARSVAVDAWFVYREVDVLVQDATVRAAIVEPGTLDIIGRQPLLGRGFLDGDDERTDPVVNLSEILWRERYEGAPAVIGRGLDLGDRPAEVVGVLPEGVGPSHIQLWIAGTPFSSDTGQGSLVVLVRLRGGITREAAEAELTNVARGAGLEHADVGLEPLDGS